MLQIHARKLASRLMPSEQWKGIIAVSRGGLVPGALLARELGIRHVDTASPATITITRTESAETCRRRRRIYRIDDLVDIPAHRVAIREMYPKAHFVTIFNRRAVRWLMIIIFSEHGLKMGYGSICTADFR